MARRAKPIEYKKIPELGLGTLSDPRIKLAIAMHKLAQRPENSQAWQPWYEDCKPLEDKMNKSSKPCGRLPANCYTCAMSWPDFPCWDEYRKSCYNKPEEEGGEQTFNNPFDDIFWSAAHLFLTVQKQITNLIKVPVSVTELKKQDKFERGLMQMVAAQGAALVKLHPATFMRQVGAEHLLNVNVKFAKDELKKAKDETLPWIKVSFFNKLNAIKKRLGLIAEDVVQEEERRRNLTFREAAIVGKAVGKFKKGQERRWRIKNYMAMGMKRRDAEKSADLAMSLMVREKAAAARHGGRSRKTHRKRQRTRRKRRKTRRKKKRRKTRKKQ